MTHVCQVLKLMYLKMIILWLDHVDVEYANSEEN